MEVAEEWGAGDAEGGCGDMPSTHGYTGVTSYARTMLHFMGTSFSERVMYSHWNIWVCGCGDIFQAMFMTIITLMFMILLSTMFMSMFTVLHGIHILQDMLAGVAGSADMLDVQFPRLEC